MTALGFVMNRASPYFAGRLQPDEVARTLAAACGHWGSGAEYLLNTVTQLEARGIHDSSLLRLQHLVAQEIEGRYAGQHKLSQASKAASADTGLCIAHAATGVPRVGTGFAGSFSLRER